MPQEPQINVLSYATIIKNLKKHIIQERRFLEEAQNISF